MSAQKTMRRRTRSRRGCADGSEVQAILSGGRAEAQIAGAPVEVLGLPDHATYREHWPLLQMAGDGWSKLPEGMTCFVSEQLSRRMNLSLGDRIEVPTQGGNWPLTIAGIYADYGNPKGQVAVDARQRCSRIFPTCRKRGWRCASSPEKSLA